MNLYSNAAKILLFAPLLVGVSSKTTAVIRSLLTPISFPRVRQTSKSDECVDSFRRFKIKFPASGEKQKRSCIWVARKKTQYRCTLPKVKDKCPVTCGECIPPTTSPTKSPTPNPTSTPTLTSSPTSSASPTGIYDWCEDLDKQFSIESIRWIKNKKNCHWASQKIWLRCAFDEVAENCPLVCNNCHCTDNKKRFEIQIGIKKTCAWPRRQNTLERCANYPKLVTNCPLTCGICIPSASPSKQPTKYP
jgi:hypothetical protein